VRFGEHGSRGSINPGGRKGESFTSTLSAHRPLLLASAPEHHVPFRFLLAFAARLAFARHRRLHWHHPANPGAGPAAVALLDGDGVRAARARERQPAGAERGRTTPGVDRPAGCGSGAQPAIRLRCHLHPPPRARLRSAGEPLHARAVPPLRHGAAQLRPECDLAGGYLRQRLRGVPGDPSELGSLGPPLPHGATHALHAGAAGAPRGARRRDDDLAAGVTQGILHSLHDDLQQHGVGAGWFYLCNDEPDLPPTPASC
jgi:hypothetical protein